MLPEPKIDSLVAPLARILERSPADLDPTLSPVCAAASAALAAAEHLAAIADVHARAMVPLMAEVESGRAQLALAEATLPAATLDRAAGCPPITRAAWEKFRAGDRNKVEFPPEFGEATPVTMIALRRLASPGSDYLAHTLTQFAESVIGDWDWPRCRTVVELARDLCWWARRLVESAGSDFSGKLTSALYDKTGMTDKDIADRYAATCGLVRDRRAEDRAKVDAFERDATETICRALFVAFESDHKSKQIREAACASE